MGYIEAWGMGIDMMNRGMLSAGLPQPLYEDTGASFIVTLTGPGEKWMAERTELPKEPIPPEKPARPRGKWEMQHFSILTKSSSGSFSIGSEPHPLVNTPYKTEYPKE